jgi:enoyl-CoA hydratase
VSDAVLTEVAERVLVITLNRPQARNAVDRETAEGVAAAVERLDADPELRVGVITGAGSAFCAGMDLKAFSRGELPVVDGRGFAGLVAAPPRKPLVAAVEGWALGGGFEIALACDLIVASRGAKFGLPEVTRGLTAAAGGLFRLPRRVPYHLAMDLVLTGRTLGAAEAAGVGLVARLTEPGEALATALELATTISANAPLAVMASKQVVSESLDWPLSESFHRQEPIVDPVRKSQDAQEGARAFAEKRPPAWRGE